MNFPRNPIRKGVAQARQQFWLCVCSLVVAGASASARLAVPHGQSGVIQSIDRQHQLIVLDMPPKPKFRIGKITKPSTFVWTENTKFIKNGEPADATGLFPGDRVRLYYRYSKRTQPPFLLKVVSSTANTKSLIGFVLIPISWPKSQTWWFPEKSRSASNHISPWLRRDGRRNRARPDTRRGKSY